MALSRSSTRRLAFTLLTAAASVPLLPAESPACSSIGPEILAIRGPETADEGEAPGAVSVTSVVVHRGRGGQSVGCSETLRSSCDDLGSIRLQLDPAVDPDSNEDEVGYVVEVVRGETPERLHLLGVAQLAAQEDGASSLRLSWIDGATDEQEPLMFWVTVHAIDADGHEGPRSEVIAVVDVGG